MGSAEVELCRGGIGGAELGRGRGRWHKLVWLALSGHERRGTRGDGVPGGGARRGEGVPGGVQGELGELKSH